MKSLNVMDLDFNLKAIINGYNSAVVERVWNGIGVINVEINSSVPNANLITIDSLIWLGLDTNKVYIVEKIEESFENNVIVYKIEGLALESLLSDFITVPPMGSGYDVVTNTREYIVRQWVYNNCINYVGRDQYPIVLGTYNTLGSSITEQTRYKNLSEEIIRVLYPENLTFKLNLDISNQQFVFNVYEPVDRTYMGATVTEKVLFGVRFGNMSTYNRTLNNLQEKNYAYVGGQGEEELRTIVEVSNVTNRRKEVFVDARDVDTTGELTERGGQNLAELQSIDNLEFEIVERQYQYETNFDLGDIVTIVYGQSEYYDRQIIRIVETYEKGQNKVECEFGITPQTLSKQLRQFNSKLTIISTR